MKMFLAEWSLFWKRLKKIFANPPTCFLPKGRNESGSGDNPIKIVVGNMGKGCGFRGLQRLIEVQ